MLIHVSTIVFVFGFGGMQHMFVWWVHYVCFCGLCIVSCDFEVLYHGFGNMFLMLWNIGIGMFLECYVKM